MKIMPRPLLHPADIACLISAPTSPLHPTTSLSLTSHPPPTTVLCHPQPRTCPQPKSHPLGCDLAEPVLRSKPNFTGSQIQIVPRDMPATARPLVPCYPEGMSSQAPFLTLNVTYQHAIVYTSWSSNIPLMLRSSLALESICTGLGSGSPLRDMNSIFYPQLNPYHTISSQKPKDQQKFPVPPCQSCFPYFPSDPQTNL